MKPVPRWAKIAGGVLLALALLVALWRWEWLIPLVEARAGAALGRPVTVESLDVDLGRVTRVGLGGVTVANPEGFAADPPFARAERIEVDVALGPLLHRRTVLPRLALTRPEVAVLGTADGANNYTFPTGEPAAEPGAPPEIGRLEIVEGHVVARVPRLKADFAADVATRAENGVERVVAVAKGTYAGQPIDGRLSGGALLSLRDGAEPYPIDLALANGPTKVRVEGRLADPLHLGGATVRLALEGANMADLTPLTGVPIPDTPPYAIAGDLAYAEGAVRFSDFKGTVGRSDLSGTIAVTPGEPRPKLTADLRSDRVDLRDLGGFIGEQPGAEEVQRTAEQKRAYAAAKADARLLPDTPVNMPKVRAADVDLVYRGHRIEGEHMPFDDLEAHLVIVDGRIALKPLKFGVGSGAVAADLDLEPQAEDRIRLTADIDFRNLDVARLMQATQAFGGAGTIGGRARLAATGNSVASFLGNGEGELVLIMTGGDLSAVLVSLSGLQFGNALVSALGLPERLEVRCAVVAMPLTAGVLDTRVAVIDTESDNILGDGSVDLKTERLDYQVRTVAKRPAVGSVPAPIRITGPLKSPAIAPGAEAAARGGAAAVLGTVLTPLAALIPTIQLGVGKDTDCGELIRRVTTEPITPPESPPAR